MGLLESPYETVMQLNTCLVERAAKPFASRYFWRVKAARVLIFFIFPAA
jgi:hypothetical protein